MKYNNIFDTHAHYDDKQFNSDRPELMTRLKQEGIQRIVNIGCDAKSNMDGIALTLRYDFIDCTVGYHPNQADTAKGNYIEVLASQAKLPKVRAIGEIGLDYHWDTPRDIQMQVFKAQLELAKDLNMPVVIHDREAHGDVLEVLKRYRPKGIVHCYSGSAELAEELQKLGFYFGFGGTVTYPNAKKTVRAAAAIRPERLVLETDSPYLPPQPFRGKRCDSSMIPHAAETLAAIKGMDTQKLIDLCNENGRRVYEML